MSDLAQLLYLVTPTQVSIKATSVWVLLGKSSLCEIYVNTVINKEVELP